MSDLRLRATSSSAVGLLLVLLVPCQVTRAVEVVYIGPNGGTWVANDNWSTGFIPHASLDEAAVISNGSTVVLTKEPVATLSA